MAAIELKKINEFVSRCRQITTLTGAYLYGIDSNGNSVKISVASIASSSGGNYDAAIADLQRRCGANEAAISALQSALQGKANSVHTHTISDVLGLQSALNGKQNTLTFDSAPTANSNNPVTSGGIKTALNAKSDKGHTHQISDITNLSTTLNDKSDKGHTHQISDVSGLQQTINSIRREITTSVPDMTYRLREVSIANNITPAYEGEIVQQSGTTQGFIDGNFYKSTAAWLYSGQNYAEMKHYGSTDDDIYICPDPRHRTADIISKKFAAILNEGDGYYYFFSFPNVVPTLADIEFLENNLIVPYTDDYDAEHDYPEFFAADHSYDFAEDPATFTYEEVEGGYRILTVSFTDKDYNLLTFSIPAMEDDSHGALLFYNKVSGKKYYSGGDYYDTRYFISEDVVSGYVVPTSPLGRLFNYAIDIVRFSGDDTPIGSGFDLWERIDVQPPTNVADGDNFLTLTNDAIGSTIDIAYNSNNQHLELKGNGGAVVSYVDMSEFIVDGMLDNVEYYTTAEQGVSVQVPYLKFTFNTDSGKSDIRISLHDLVDIYDGANINLTSAFVKAAQYSAPAIGDSMNVAIGKLLKGHEDNATALEQKATSTQGGYADSALQTVTASGSGYVTLTAGQKSGNNGAKTQALSASLTMQALATADAQHQGLAEASDVKAAIDSAIGGVPNALKQVDLSTYQGSTEGEIVQHVGATTSAFVNGYIYKRTSAAPYPADTKALSLSGLTRDVTDPVDVLAMIRDTTFFVTEEKITLYKGGNMKLYVGDKGYPAIGDSIIGNSSNLSFYDVTVVYSDTYPFSVGYSRSSTLNVTTSLEVEVYENSDGVKIIGYLEYTDAVKISPITGSSEGFCVIYDGKLHKFMADTVWAGNSDLLTPPPSWQQWDAQPPVDISGKQNTITGAASTITTANLTASKILGSDANGKVAATSIATADAEDAVSKRHTQNTDTKIQSGNNKVEVSASGTSITGNGSVSGNLSVSGDLNVTGKETVEEIVNIKSENNFITLRDGAQTAIASGSLSGTKVENYDGLGNDLLFGTDASGTFRIGDEGGTLEPIATRDEASNLTDGQLMKWDAVNQRMVGINDIRANTVNGAPLSNSASYFYGVSTSAANATQKEVSIPSITTLNEGQVIVVMPTITSDTINNATLKLNDFAAYPIVCRNSHAANWQTWIANTPVAFVFLNDEWKLLAKGYDTAYSILSVADGIAGTSTVQTVVRADYLQQIIHGQIDKFVGTRAMTEDAYWDMVTAGTVQADTLYITFDNDWEG